MKIIIVVSLWTGSLFIVVGSLVKNIYEKARMEGREKLSSPDPNRKDFSQANPLQTGTIYRKVQTRIIQDVSHMKGKRNKPAKHSFKERFIKITEEPNT